MAEDKETAGAATEAETAVGGAIVTGSGVEVMPTAAAGVDEETGGCAEDC